MLGRVTRLPRGLIWVAINILKKLIAGRFVVELSPPKSLFEVKKTFIYVKSAKAKTILISLHCIITILYAAISAARLLFDTDIVNEMF